MTFSAFSPFMYIPLHSRTWLDFINISKILTVFGKIFGHDAVAANQFNSFAASSGAVALDGDGFTENSPYARALLELLDQLDLEIRRLDRKLGRRVSELTNGTQQPVKRDSSRSEDLF